MLYVSFQTSSMLLPLVMLIAGWKVHSRISSFSFSKKSLRFELFRSSYSSFSYLKIEEPSPLRLFPELRFIAISRVRYPSAGCLGWFFKRVLSDWKFHCSTFLVMAHPFSHEQSAPELFNENIIPLSSSSELHNFLHRLPQAALAQAVQRKERVHQAKNQ